MPISDNKKAQTLINTAGQEILIMRAAMVRLKAVRTLFQLVNPDVTGTPLEGNLSLVNTAMDALDVELSKLVWSGMISAIEPTHNNKALD